MSSRQGRQWLRRTLPQMLAAGAVAFAICGAARAEESGGSTAGITSAAQVPQAPAGAPNVVLVLLDDVSFGATSTFGGPAITPALESLARDGLRYNRFHTTAICSPTRASLLSGRNAHAINMGAVMNVADSRPGYIGMQAQDASTIAEILRQSGYHTAAFGKWHQTPEWEVSQAGPFDRWPTRQGFEKFYGFMGGETNQFEPSLFEGTTRIVRPAGNAYHLTEDLADQAIGWTRAQTSLTPDKPFFVYFAPGATHAPLQVPKEWITRYRGQFNGGWDKMREQILARQKKLGVVPANTVLTPRPDGMPEWSSLSGDEQKLAARLMETYAAYLAHTDFQIGKLVQSLKDSGQYDNTLFIYIVGDNGGSAEGGAAGSLNFMGTLQGIPEKQSDMLARMDDIGSSHSYAQYSAGWAWALNSPFQWMKTVASHLGGTRNPMVVSWPKRITDKGGVRSQFGHVNDITPTILEAAGLTAPVQLNGIPQRKMDGTSLVYSFADPKAPERHTTQYFEVFSNRAIYHDGWMASAFHGRRPWMFQTSSDETSPDNDRWELYDLRKDFSQSKDLAAKEPQRLEAMKSLFMEQAAANQVLPLKGPVLGLPGLPNLSGKRTEFTFYPGLVGVPESSGPKMANRSWSIRAAVDVPASGARGVIAAIGGSDAGWSLYLDGDGKPRFTYKLFDMKTVDLAAANALPAGKSMLEVDFDYDGGGYAKGGTLKFSLNGKPVGAERLPMSPPGFFSIIETFDVGIDTGSSAAHYPDNAAVGYPFQNGQIERVDIKLR